MSASLRQVSEPKAQPTAEPPCIGAAIQFSDPPAADSAAKPLAVAAEMGTRFGQPDSLRIVQPYHKLLIVPLDHETHRPVRLPTSGVVRVVQRSYRLV